MAGLGQYPSLKGLQGIEQTLERLRLLATPWPKPRPEARQGTGIEKAFFKAFKPLEEAEAEGIAKTLQKEMFKAL